MTDTNAGHAELDGAWQRITIVRQELELGETDICRVTVQAGETASVARTRNAQYPTINGQVTFDHVQQDLRPTALMAIDALVRAQLMFPLEVLEPGLLSGPEVMAIADATWALIRQDRRQIQVEAYDHDRLHPSAVVAAARAAGLAPEPDVTKSGQWQARCPGTNHRLLIQPEIEKFFCGYCRRSGTAEELREFVGQRNASPK